ncbi:MAG: hypothetical protein QOE35_1660 [Actinomycetota bacterium]|jgi:glycosyltransferase involved in cell wall biosynthesis
MADGPDVRRALRVGLDLVYLEKDSGGSGTYARELIRAIERVEPDTDVVAWVGTRAPHDLDELPCDVVRLGVRSTGSFAHLPVELLGLGWAAKRRALDVVHGLAYATPIVGPVARVVTILDVTWLREPRSVNLLARSMFRVLTQVCGRTADAVIAISEAARNDIVASLPIAADRVKVTPLGVAPTQHRGRGSDANRLLGCEPDDRVVLAVGQVAEHKNLVRVIDALALPNRRDIVLAVAGRRTRYAEAVEGRARSCGLRCRVLGFVDDTTLESLYARADVAVLASRSEGFGLPVLEAMVRGVPVACSDIAVLREVTGGAAALFDPLDAGDMSDVLCRTLDDKAYRSELVARGHRRALEATWDVTAALTLHAYRTAMARRSSR